MSIIKKERKKRANSVKPQEENKIHIKEIIPLTIAQDKCFTAFENGKNLVLHGLPGTGKTFISMYLALEEILKEDTSYSKIVIVRSAVPSRNIGYLPGTIKDKMDIYEMPYDAICNELFPMRNPYAFLKTKGMIEFVSTSFIRGLTFNDTIFIIDEIQNMTAMELHSIITRIGKNSRFIMCGDYRQNDLIDNKSGQSGIGEIMKVMALIKSVDTVEFNVEDIVRSGIVKEYIIARHKLGLA
jgi:phosphate starvation-inducible protein PhoH